MMHVTPVSLLDRLCKNSETSVWDRFVELYSPLLFHWAKRLYQQDSDASDLVQEVFVILWQKLPQFQYDPKKSFHAWLKTLFLNQYRMANRRQIPVPQNPTRELEAPDPDSFDDPEWRQYLIRKAFTLIEKEFTPLQQKAFRSYVLEEKNPEEVAKKFGLSPGTVYSIKSKILSRLRQELRGLLD